MKGGIWLLLGIRQLVLAYGTAFLVETQFLQYVDRALVVELRRLAYFLEHDLGSLVCQRR